MTRTVKQPTYSLTDLHKTVTKPKPTEKRYVYIVAYTPKGKDPILSFKNIFITAKSKDEAYSIGMSELDDTIKGTLQNNWVIRIP